MRSWKYSTRVIGCPLLPSQCIASGFLTICIEKKRKKEKLQKGLILKIAYKSRKRNQ